MIQQNYFIKLFYIFRYDNSNFIRRLTSLMLILVVGIIFLGSDLKKLDLKLHKEKNNTVIVEVIHKPRPDARWIYVEGLVEDEDNIYTSQSLIQSDGENCNIIHRISWRNLPRGILKVEVRIRDSRNKQIDFTTKSIILG